MVKETIKSIKEKSYKELLDDWLCQSYPDIYMFHMLTCHKCGKKFIQGIDSKTKKINKYLWRPNCECLGKNLRVSIG